MVADPNNNSVYWSGGHYTFAMFSSRTTNSGSNWTRYYLEPIGYVYALAVDPNNSNIVYAGGNPGVYRTTNAGADWTDVSTGLTDIVMELAIDPYNTTTLYAASRDGVFKTTNSGGVWTNTGCTEATTLVLDPTVQGTIYCGTTNGVYVSTDGSGTWTSMNAGLDDTNVTCIRIDPDNYLFVGTANNGLYRWPLNTGCTEIRNIQTGRVRCCLNPNPVTHSATITYQTNISGRVLITLYNVHGQAITTLLDEEKNAGTYSLLFENIDIPTGIYFVHVKTRDGVCGSKFIYCK